MNRTQLLQLSADLDRVIELRSDDDESHWLRNTAATVGTVGTAGVGASYLAGRNLNGPFLPGTEGALGKIGRGSARIGKYAGAVGNEATNAGKMYSYTRDLGLGRGAAAKGALSGLLGKLKGVRLSAKTENLLTLSAELDQVINFDLAGNIGKALWRGTTGRAALKWGGIGAGVGALAGGLEGGLSDDPNKSVIGGAFKGAAAGGALGAIGGGGMRAYKSYGAMTAGRAANGGRILAKAVPAAAAPATATAAADQMAARAASAPSQVAGQTTHGSAAYPNTSVADALAAKRAAAAPAGLPAGVRPRGADELRKPNLYSSRLQSLVQLSADLDGVVELARGDIIIKKLREVAPHELRDKVSVAAARGDLRGMLKGMKIPRNMWDMDEVKGILPKERNRIAGQLKDARASK